VACSEVLVARDTCKEKAGAVVRREHLIAVVGAFLIGCAVLLLVGCAGMRSEAPKEDEQERSPQATTTEEEARCGGTRTVDLQGRTYTTNDVSGCPRGGLLSGTDGRDKLDGEYGDDEIRGLGAMDAIFGGLGSDVIYGGPGDDLLEGSSYWSDESIKDVLHGGPGRDLLGGRGGR
jgi:hypothetical protein